MPSGSDASASVPPRRRVLAALATAANALYVLSLQILALVTLDPTQFGLFSIQYLLFALASSLTLSIVSEPWLRRTIHERVEGGWREYSTVLAWLSLTVAIVTLVVSLLVPPLRDVAWLGAAAVFLSAYRTGARYHDVRSGRWKRVLFADSTGCAAIVGAWVAGWALELHPLLAIVVSWACGALVTSVFSPLPRMLGLGTVRRWLTIHRAHVAPLLRDSILLDVGAIGTPFVVAGALGITNFGIYRAVSNIAAPVRLLLNPLRPTLSSIPLAVNARASTRAIAIAVGAAFGAGAFVALWLVGVLTVDLGALSAVVPFAFPTAVFVAANFLGHYYYILARSHSHSRGLMAGRIVQTMLAIAMPLFGVVAFGLAGAIWGYALATVLSAATWFAIVASRSAPEQ